MVNKYPFKLRFNKKFISKWANQYPHEYDAELETILAPQVRQRGYLLKPEFEKLCRWKTPRSQKRVASNPADYIEAVTQIALSSPNERLRVEVLLLLDGVSWPTASVILHFCHTEAYPILDFRALWSLGVDASTVTYNFELWHEYTLYCRKLANEAGVSMRELDRALWKYSEVYQ
jgi:hypothetical protein